LSVVVSNWAAKGNKLAIPHEDTKSGMNAAALNMIVKLRHVYTDGFVGHVTYEMIPSIKAFLPLDHCRCELCSSAYIHLVYEHTRRTHILWVIWIVRRLGIENCVAMMVQLEIASHVFAKDALCLFWLDHETRMVGKTARVRNGDLTVASGLGLARSNRSERQNVRALRRNMV
jgi:hypothetical protein